MFQSFERYNRILVTGPMRSGTTICARMIARDTGKLFVPEEEMFSVWPHQTGVVVQAPVLLSEARRLSCCGWFVVVMQRNTDDILASIKKFMKDMLPPEQIEIMSRKQIAQAAELADFIEQVGPGQRVVYEQLASHPMWVEDRTGFGPRQISTSITDRTLRS